MKRYILSSLLVFLYAVSFTQARFNTYIDRPIDANYSGHISDVEITFDGGYVTVSGSSSLNITKFSQTGSLLWSRDVSWGGGIYYARHVVQLKDSGYAVTGTGGPGYDPSTTWEIAFMRLDKNGNLVWVESFNGASQSFNMGSHILQTLDGGLLVVGQYNSHGILIKTDINGGLQWANTYSPLTRFLTAFQKADSSYVVWGVNDNNSGFAAGKILINKSGGIISGKAYALGSFTQYLAVKKTADGGFIAKMDQYGTSPILMKTDSTDAVQWAKLYTFTTPNNSRDPRDVEPVDGGYVFTGEDFTNPAYGSGFSTAFWAKTDYSGNILWVRDYDTQYWDVAYSVKQTADKGLVIWTSMFTNGSAIVADLIKTDSLGNSVCTLYKDTATSAPITLSPSVITVTSSAVTGITVRSNSYSGAVTNAVNPCSSSPVAQFNADHLTVCAGSTVNFTDQSAGTPTSWKWTFTGGSPASSTAQNPSVTYNTPGMYNVKLVATNTSGTDSITKTAYITVTPSPVAGSISASRDSFCAGAPVTLLVSDSSASMQWQSSADGISFTNIIGDSSTTYYNPSVNQTTYYRVKTAGACGADTTPVFKLLVYNLPMPVVSVSDTLICSSDSSLVQTSASYSSYLWNNADTLYYTYAKQAGGYWVTVTDANGCSAASNHVTIGVYPVPSVSIVVQGDTLSSFGAVAYQWYKDDSIIPGATSSIYVVHETGDYAVQITDTNGCTTISNPEQIVITGINEMVTRKQLTIYPNPFNDFIFIQRKDLNLEIQSAEIYDIPGRLILSGRITDISSSRSTVDVSPLPCGMYFIKIKTNGEEFTFKLVKQL